MVNGGGNCAKVCKVLGGTVDITVDDKLCCNQMTDPELQRRDGQWTLWPIWSLNVAITATV